MKKRLKKKILGNVAKVTKSAACGAIHFPSLFCFYEPRIPEKLRKKSEGR